MSDEKEAAGTAVLVVDDSETDRTLVTGLISRERPDWTVLSRSAAAEGLELLASQPVAAVITDLFMPEMSGEEFLVEVRQRFPAVPVILITSQGDDEIAARSLELGAVNYVPKRRLSDDLLPAIDEVLRSAGEASVARNVMTHLVRSQTVFRIDSDLEQIRSLLHLIRERLQSLQVLQENEVREVTDAVREALMNAYTHGGQPAGDAAEHRNAGNDQPAQAGGSAIEVALTQTPERLCFAITDQGPGFDTSTFADHDTAGSGSGFHTMARHMDSIDFNEQGNRIALTKELTPPNVL